MKFNDNQFSVGNEILGDLAKKYENIEWIRAQNLIDVSSLQTNKSMSRDVQQGQIHDESLLSALSAIAKEEKRTDNILL